MFSTRFSIGVLLLVCKIVLSSSSSNVFMIQEVPKPSSNATRVEKQRAENLILLEKSLELKLKAIKSEELGIPIIQEIVDSWTFSENAVNDSVLVEQIASSISGKLDPAIKIIREICSFLTNKEHKKQIFFSLMNPCPNNDNIDDKINHFYNEIYLNITGEINFDLLNDRNLIFHKYLIENIGKTQQSWQSYRQYFLSTSDSGKIENCNYVPDVAHFIKLYASAIMNKRVVLLIDQTSEQMDTTRTVAKTVIAALNDTDKVSVILIADKVTIFSRSDSCQNETMTPVTPVVKHKIYDFLDSANRTNGIANHTLGFQVAFSILEKLYNETMSTDLLPISFLYISEGVTDLFADARNVLAEITMGQSRLPHPIVINICAIVANNRQFPTQAQFLLDIASQNYIKYSLDTSSWWHRKGSDRSLNGQVFLMNRTMERFQRNLLLCLTELFNYKSFINSQVTLHHPFFDSDFSNDFVVSVTKTCDQRGVFGIDLLLNFLVEDVLYSNQINSSYKFLTDMNGYTFAHSLLYPRPITLRETFHPVHITLLEQSNGFDDVWTRIRAQENGSVRLDNLTYTWRHVSALMIVCIVTDSSESGLNVLQRIKASNNQMMEQNKFLPELIYHRLDLLIPPNSINMCHYFKQVATFDAITLHLSSKAFKSPFAHMRNSKQDDNDDSQVQTVQNFMAYLRDTKNLFANPGLLDGIRNEVSGVYQIMELLKKKHNESELRKYIIRRYVASMNGVLQVYPGCSLDVNFEASRRPWFMKAMESKGRIAVTEPYLDAGGAGFVVSVSYTIYESKHSSSGRETKPIAVVSLDFTRGFFYKMLLDESPDCGVDNIKCFMMNDKGFLIAHPNILEMSSDNHRQPEHITHKESHVANDILMQRKFVKKIACNDYLNGTSQRFYQFNTSITEVVTNFANVEKTKYQIMNIRETNLFVGIINSTSETSGAFCPCSTIDFRCLNCFRMEQIECECPCECRITDDNSCSSNRTELMAESSTCTQPTEYIHNYQAPNVRDVVDTCNLFNCDLFSEREDCLGVIGCIW